MLTPWKDKRGERLPAVATKVAIRRETCVRASFQGGRPAGPRARFARIGLCLLLLALGLGSLAGTASAQTAAGTPIDNVGQAVFRNGFGVVVPVDSNLDRIVVDVRRTPSVVEFLKYGLGFPFSTNENIGPQSCSQSGDATGPFVPAPSVTTFAGAPIDLNAPVPIVADGAYHAGEPVFVRLIDLDQNLDSALVETALVTLISDGGDRETLELSETGPATGTFIGVIQSATPPPVPGDCRISVGPDDTIRAEYTDPADGTDASSDVTLVDPFGIVFDSATGAAIDGATITLWDVLLGAPAAVVGDDGLSAYPSTIVSGGTATDASGTAYNFAPGRYRFPFVAPGQYELRVVPPATHAFPTAETDPVLQTLPGAPYALVTGSRGEVFTVPVGPAVQVDIPLDPLSTGLLVTKQASKARAGAGEFVPYRVRATNATGAILVAAEIVDRLPPGLRYERDSGERLNAGDLEPTISDDGRVLTFALGDVPAGETVEIVYVARVLPDTPPGEAENQAFLQAQGGLVSNTAVATISIERDLFEERAWLLGRVHIDACELEPDEPAEGLEGVRLYLEDGSFVVTDAEGRFHFEAISAGLHVVQLDTDSLPEEYEAVLCDQDQRKARRPFSEFVELQPGTLWRSDFHVRRKEPLSGPVSQVFEVDRADEALRFQLTIGTGRVEADEITAMIRLPEPLALRTDSVRLGDEQVEAAVDGEMMIVRVGAMPGEHERILSFEAVPTASSSELVEVRSILRARSGTGKTAMTKPALLRFPLAEAPPAPETELAEAAEPEVEPEAPEPVQTVLGHRLLNDRRDGLMQYVLQVFVTEELPEVIVAEVELPVHEQLLKWTPRNELGNRVTTVQVDGRTRFILPRHASRRAVRIFLEEDREQRVLQVFFAAEPLAKGQARAKSRILPIETLPASAGGGGRRVKRPAMPGVHKTERAADPHAPRKKPSVLAEADAAAREGRTVLRDRNEVVVETEPTGNPAAPSVPEEEKVERPSPTARFDANWLESAVPGNGFVYPEEGALPRIPSLKLGIQHDPNHRVALFLGGAPVDPVHLSGRIQNESKTIALTRWRGVGLEEGPNLFEAVFYDRDDNEVGRVQRQVHLAGAPVRGQLAEEASMLLADGRTSPVVALRLFDRWGQPVREGSTGQFDLDPPYQTQEEVDSARDRPLDGIGFERPSFVVDDDGLARIRLFPTSVVGEARLRFQFREGREDEIVAWLEPGDRDWVLVGLATGTLGWNTTTGDDAARNLSDAEDGLYQEGRVAFFAKGRLPGEFLLTAAYDTDADETRLRDRLFQTLEPDEHYTLYGDTTQRDFDAPTSSRVYVKIERKRFYALYGDYQTGLEETELGRYARTLTGAKVEYQGDHLEVNGFVTNSDQSFVRDELLGDGTSGLYRLSRERIVPGSETIMIETRDRFRPELVVSSEPQARFTDYDIDYRDGTIFFRRPIPQQDPNFDPIFIVVDYETNERADNAVTGGGRVAAKTADGRFEVGFTGLHEGGDQIESQLFAGDVTVRINDETELRGEFAHSRGDDFTGDREDEAWLVELDHRSELLDLRAYAKEQGQAFGLGQQRGTQGGIRSYGIDAGVDWTQTWRSETSLFRQENLATGAERNVAEVRTRYEAGRYGANAGVRYAGEDTDLGSGHSVQVLGGGRADFFDGKFSLRAEGEGAVSEDAFGDFPHRAILGADWQVHEKVTLFADQEFTFGDNQRSSDTRGGIRGTPWKGASVSTSVVQETREFGPRTYANLGLQQRWDVMANWGFDISIDRTATIRDPGNDAFNTTAPAASGSFADDYTAVSIGTAYREGAWSGTGRVEARFGEREDRFGFIAGLLHDENEDLSWSMRTDFFYSNARSGSEELRSDSSLSLAYRPLRSKWIILDRIDFDYRDNSGGQFDFESRKLLHYFKANQLFDRRTQLAWQLSNKLVIDTIEGDRFTTFGTLAGVEMRRSFAKDWDMSMHGRIRHQTAGDEISYGYGLSVGRVLLDNVWFSVGYNLVGFEDPEFSAADYTAQGPFFRVRAKFDQLSVQDALQAFR